MRSIKNTFLFLVALLVGMTAVVGQHIPFKLFTPHDGLPQSQVISMFQDSRGYIWVGTQGGLAYFDGATFHALTAKDGLPFDGIMSIGEDSKGNITFLTGKWVCQYDGKSISYDTTGIRVKDGGCFLDKHDVLWAVSATDNLPYFSKNWKDWTLATKSLDVLNGRKWLNSQADVHAKRVYLLSSDLASFTLKDGHLKPLSREKEQFSAWVNVRDTVRFGFRADSIFEFREGCFKFWEKSAVAASMGVQTSSGDFYYTNRFNQTLYRIDPSGGHHAYPIGVPINFLFLDRDENLWVAAEAGLVRVFQKGFQDFTKSELDGIWSMAEDASGDMWFGSYFNQSLKKYDGKSFIAQKFGYSLRPGMNVGAFNPFYFGGGRDSKGNLYFSNADGILKYDGKKFRLFGDPNFGVSFNLTIDTTRNILVSGQQGGAKVIDLKTGATRFFGTKEGLFRAINVLGVAKDGTGRFWLAMSRGMAVLDVEKGKITKNYTRESGNFPHYGTLCAFGDFKGNIWAGSAKALLWHDAQRDTFIEVAPNIIHTNVNAITAYRDRFLVIGANDGVYFLDLNAFYGEGKIVVRHFNQHNGYTGIEPNQNSLFADSKGNIWVSASDIVTKITPSELDMSLHPLGIFITEINNERVKYENYGKAITLPDGINTAKIRFEAVGFERPGKTEFSYQCDGGEWSEWRTEDFAILDNLSSGTYTFRVRTRPAGTVNPGETNEASIQIRVDAPLIKEWWFPWVGAFGFALLIGWALYYVRRTRRQGIEQEERDLDRIRQIKYLQIQTLQAQLNPHFIFNVLQAIQTRIYEGDREEASSLIVNLGHLIRRFLDSSVNMDLARGRNSEITVKQEINLLKSYIEFEQLQYSNKFDYGIHYPESLDIENICVPPMLIQPYVENAIKHGILYEKERRCRVDVRFEKTGDERLVVTIADDGVGRARAREIQENFIRMYKSRGTQLLEERIKIMQELGHNISVEPKDNPDGGTIVTLTIDL